MDLTGDGHADIVVTADHCDTTVGQSHWDVYPGSPSAFAAAPSPFAVPAPRCQVNFDALAAASSITYSMLDLTGDGHPDLVVTADDCDSTLGQSHWDVYAWGSSGFAAAPTAFSLPAPRCQVKFDALAAASTLTYSTTDITGDGHPDIVVTADGCDTTVGQSHWDVYAWGAGGFSAAPSPFTVPAPRCQVHFDAFGAASTLVYSTVDITADGHPDIVVTADHCDSTVGQTHWDVYSWSTGGFSAAPSPFSVPAPRCQTDFNALAAASSVTYSTVDLTGSKRPDLVVYADPCDKTVGQSHWDVYTWGSGGFSAAPSSFVVPAPRCQTDFNAGAAFGSLSYTLTDLTNACTPGLVVVDDHCDTTVGQSHWDVYTQK
jgi:hypothetical protein